MTAPRVRLDIDATREKLAALGLGHAVEALEGLLAEAVSAEMPAHVFLDCQSARNLAPGSAPNFDPRLARSGTRPGGAVRVAETGRGPLR